jgi:hypothetical protein
MSDAAIRDKADVREFRFQMVRIVDVIIIFYYSPVGKDDLRLKMYGVI